MSTWKFGGTDLTTFGSLTELDDPNDIPDRRGEDITIPFKTGSVSISKYYDKRTMLFGLTLSSTSVSGLQTLMDNLKKLIGVRTEQTLEWTLDDASVRTAQAKVDKKMQTRRLGPLAIRAVLEFTLAQPFFRSNTLYSIETTINASPKTFTVSNTGTVEERNAKITLTGPLENTVITDTLTGVSLKYTGAIAGGEVVVIETNATGEYTAVKDGVTNVVGNILDHSGSSALMVFEHGNNPMSVTDDIHTTGKVKFEFYPPYL
jgi:hypothetical protein